MCGIVGTAARVPLMQRDWLALGSDAMLHRGPDDSGEWWSKDGRVGLAHRRLAIVDLSSSGHQPMHDSEGQLSIVFNGEIYNYRDIQVELISRGHAFKSNSDTEVILAAYREWGIDCVNHLNGMFALGIYDSRSRCVFLARDRAGEKPLFYSWRNKVLRFASELKGLVADSRFERRIDPEALDIFLATGYVPGDRCILRDVMKLGAGHALKFDLDTDALRVWRYWRLPDAPSEIHPGVADEQILLDEFEVLFENAVHRQLQADVPVGVLLSGGVDSSLVTAMAVRSSAQVKTFTVGFPAFGAYDESEHARLIARYFNTDHYELNADRVGPGVLPLLAAQYDEPIIESSMIPAYLVSRLVREHCTVALGGDGGDELFGGYSSYSNLLKAQAQASLIPTFMRKLIRSGAETLLPTGFRGRHTLRCLDSDWRSGLPIVPIYFDSAERQALLGNRFSFQSRKLAEQVLKETTVPSSDIIQRATRTDFSNYMVDDILVKVDRASMLNSLEVRAPMLDFRVIEFAFGRIPSSLKTSLNERKIFLKKLTSKLLPPQFDRQRKQGFSIPLAKWLSGGPWRDYFRSVLFSEGCLFDSDAVSKLMHGQDKKWHNQERLFGLVMFELWRRHYKVTL